MARKDEALNKIPIVIVSIMCILLGCGTTSKNVKNSSTIPDYSIARKNLEKKISEEPGNYEAYFYLGSIYSAEGQYKKALELYKRSLEIEPQYYQAWCESGVAYFNMGYYPESIQCHEKALECGMKKPAMAHYNIGVAYDFLGDQEGAISEYEKAVYLDPNYTKAYNNLGIIYQERGKDNKAEEEFKKAIEIEPCYADAHFNLGILYWHRQEWLDVVSELSKTIECEPNHKQAKQIMDKIEEAKQKAAKEYNKANSTEQSIK